MTCIDAIANCGSKGELRITRETTLSRIGAATFGFEDITSGNEALDRLVVIKGVPKHVMERIVRDADLQKALVALFQHGGWIEVDLKGAHYRQGRLAETQVLRPILEALTRTASALENATR